MAFMTFQKQLGMEQSSQLTKSIIFQRGRYTINQIFWRNVQQDLVPLLTSVYQKTGYDVPICQVLRIVALYSIS